MEDSNGVQHQRRRSSAPKIARDLLPTQPEGAKPGYHTIFGNLILDDDPMDGSRSLRKRKASEGTEEKSRPTSRKRTRTSSEVSAGNHGLAKVSPVVDEKHHTSPPKVIDFASISTSQRPSRVRASRRSEKQLVNRIASEDSLLLVFRLHPTKLINLDREPQKRKRRERERARRAQAQRAEEVIEEVSHYPALQPFNLTTQMASFLDRDGDANKSKPYGGILSEAEADTLKTFPQAGDRRKFEEARLKAEDGWKRKAQKLTTSETPRPAKSSGSASKIKCINFGGYEIDTWHDAPYPEEYSQSRVLYICEFCLKYMNSDYVAWRHKVRCVTRTWIGSVADNFITAQVPCKTPSR